MHATRGCVSTTAVGAPSRGGSQPRAQTQKLHQGATASATTAAAAGSPALAPAHLRAGAPASTCARAGHRIHALRNIPRNRVTVRTALARTFCSSVVLYLPRCRSPGPTLRSPCDRPASRRKRSTAPEAAAPISPPGIAAHPSVIHPPVQPPHPSCSHQQAECASAINLSRKKKRRVAI
jgi:hypothetical protein